MCVSVFIIIANGIAKEEALKEEMIDIKKSKEKSKRRTRRKKVKRR